MHGFSPLWLKRWVLRSEARPNVFWHWAHLCAFSPLWVSMWRLRVPAKLKDFSHWAHLCDFTPLWVSRWVFKPDAWLNDLLHSAQLCGFSSVWNNICWVNLLAYENDLRHMTQDCLLAMYKLSTCSLKQLLSMTEDHRFTKWIFDCKNILITFTFILMYPPPAMAKAKALKPRFLEQNVLFK